MDVGGRAVEERSIIGRGPFPTRRKVWGMGDLVPLSRKFSYFYLVLK